VHDCEHDKNKFKTPVGTPKPEALKIAFTDLERVITKRVVATD